MELHPPRCKFIVGPCAIESVDSFVRFADDLVRLFERFPAFELIYKGSFDKANRTLPGSPRGVGLVDAEVAWYKLRRNHPTLRILTDVHETWQCQHVAVMVDVLQIPAFLGRQTSLLEAASLTGAVVNVKKPQWEDVDFFDSVDLKLPDAKEVWYTYRGTGTKNNLKFDLNEINDMVGTIPAAFAFADVTHTNQSSMWKSCGLARGCAAVGIRNFFAETHPSPKDAICDATHQLSRRALSVMLEQLSDLV